MSSRRKKLDQGLIDILSAFAPTSTQQDINRTRQQIFKLFASHNYRNHTKYPSKDKYKNAHKQPSYFASVGNKQAPEADRKPVKKSTNKTSQHVLPSRCETESRVPKEVLRLLDTQEYCSTPPKHEKRCTVKVQRYADLVVDMPTKRRRDKSQEKNEWRVIVSDDEEVPISLRLARKKETENEGSTSAPQTIKHEPATPLFVDMTAWSDDAASTNEGSNESAFSPTCLSEETLTSTHCSSSDYFIQESLPSSPSKRDSTEISSDESSNEVNAIVKTPQEFGSLMTVLIYSESDRLSTLMKSISETTETHRKAKWRTMS